MKYCTTLTLLLCCALFANAQKLVTINVESLSKPEKTLRTESYQTILEDLIRADNGVSRYPLNVKHTDPAFNIIAKSHINDSLVSFGYHPFFEGMYNAYAQHRPFTLSPDIVWLLICQGFSQHVNNNSDDLRKMFVDFNGKLSLVVRNDKILLDDPNSPWEEVFPEFTKQISNYTGSELTNTMTANFSTTTQVTKTASQITLMDAMKSYFEFIVIRVGCGIPKVTLEGTPQDWESVLSKTEALRKYKLDWWVNQLEPVLKNIIKASNGKKDRGFWQDMFAYHKPGRCGARDTIDGWMVKFFPYKKDGSKNDLVTLSTKDVLPDEIVKVDLTYESNGGMGGGFQKTPLELWAGFVGLKQNDKTFDLEPEIGWMIRKKDAAANEALINKLRNDDAKYEIAIRVKTIPDEVLALGQIRTLDVYFVDDIKIPDEMGKMAISTFRMQGKISDDELKRVCKLLPNTRLIINGKSYGAAKF